MVDKLGRCMACGDKRPFRRVIQVNAIGEKTEKGICQNGHTQEVKFISSMPANPWGYYGSP